MGSISHTSRSGSLACWVLVLGVPLLALLVVRPWVSEALPIWDHGDIVVLLRDTKGPFSAFREVAGAYREEGRVNLLSYAQIALTWSLVGESSLGWQLQRAMFMGLMGVGFAIVARRLGAPPLVAGLGGLVLLLGVSSVEGWLFIMGEPLAVCLLVLMLAFCIDYQRGSEWRRDSVMIALLGLLVLLTKEMLGFAILPIIAMALFGDENRYLRWPTWAPRDRRLILLLAAALAVKLLLLIPTLTGAAPGAYASDFGTRGPGAHGVAALFRSMSLPAWFASSGLGALLYPANLLAPILIFGGGFLALRRDWPKIPALSLLALLPGVGAVVYSFWPRYSGFYGMPFWAGATGLLVCGAVMLQAHSRLGRLLAPIVLGLIAGYSAIVADRTVREKYALAGLTEDVARQVPGWPGADSVLVVAPNGQARHWPVKSAELRRYGQVLDAYNPQTVYLDVNCQEVMARFDQGLTRAALLNDPLACGPLPIRTGTHTRAYRYLDWVSFQWIESVLVVESLVPALASGAAPPGIPNGL